MKSEKPKSKLLMFILGLSFMLPSMGLCQAQESPTAGQVARKVTPVAAKTVGQKAWMKLHPAMSDLRQKRVEAFIDHVNEIRRILKKTMASVDTEPFAEEILGYEALFSSVDQSTAERYIERKLSALVLDSDTLTAEIQKVYNSFHVTNIRLTEAFLINNRIDVDVDPNVLKTYRVDSSFVNSQMSRQKALLVDHFYDACKEHLLAMGVGIAASTIGSNMSHLGDDEYGNATIASGIWGFIGGAASEMLAEQVTLDAMGTKKKVAGMARQSINAFLSSLSGSGDTFEGCDRALIDMFHKHEHLLLQSVADFTRVDADFANANLPK
jgi:hypothetical protein